jgi:predicted ArsR family transcriptional regulator
MTYITEYQQDEYARRWKESIRAGKVESTKDERVGRVKNWPKYKSLFERHKSLTDGDVSTMIGISLNAARLSLHGFKRKGLVSVSDRVDGTAIWEMVE